MAVKGAVGNCFPPAIAVDPLEPVVVGLARPAEHNACVGVARPDRTVAGDQDALDVLTLGAAPIALEIGLVPELVGAYSTAIPPSERSCKPGECRRRRR